MKTVSATTSDPDYRTLEFLVRERVASLTGPLFTTNAKDLWGVYLGNITEDRQHYSCNACRRFIERFGGLATITLDGGLRSALWQLKVPDFFAESVASMEGVVKSASVTGVFVNDQATWGLPEAGGWTHLSGSPNLPIQGTRLKTAPQIAAEKVQDFGILKHGLACYPVEAVRQAVRVLKADALDRSEKTLGVAEWLLDLHYLLEGLRGRSRDNVVWLAVATAPPGFCHVRSTMISTLLDDIVLGLPYEEIARRWADKMHPLKYQRPTAQPSDGAIKRANEVVDKLNADGALERRFARLEEVVAFWKPAEATGDAEGLGKPKGGTFDHLRKRSAGVKELELPAVKMTWTRFSAEVLPKARSLEVKAPGHGAYYGMVTAANADSAPILQWDSLEQRNPVSWFFYHRGSMALTWGLVAGDWTKVNAICHKPPHWHGTDKFRHENQAAFLVLEGAKLTGRVAYGGFFPECLRSEFHEVRKVLEAYANESVVAGADEGTANGYALQKGQEYHVTLRVNAKDLYLIDRWE